MMSSKSSVFVDFMIFCLLVIYIGSYFVPTHWGVKCDEDNAPYGLGFLSLFYIVWTFFTVRSIRNDPLLALGDKSWKEIY
jgi:hypothetical protein